MPTQLIERTEFSANSEVGGSSAGFLEKFRAEAYEQAKGLGRAGYVLACGTGSGFLQAAQEAWLDKKGTARTIAYSALLGGGLGLAMRSNGLLRLVGTVSGAALGYSFYADVYSPARWGALAHAVSDAYRSPDNLSKDVLQVKNNLGHFVFDAALGFGGGLLGGLAGRKLPGLYVAAHPHLIEIASEVKANCRAIQGVLSPELELAGVPGGGAPYRTSVHLNLPMTRAQELLQRAVEMHTSKPDALGLQHSGAFQPHEAPAIENHNAAGISAEADTSLFESRTPRTTSAESEALARAEELRKQIKSPQFRGDVAKARSLLEEALKLQEAHLLPDDLRLADTRLDLACVLHSQYSTADKAAPLFRKALDSYEKVLGPDDRYTIKCRQLFAAQQIYVGKWRSGARLYEQALASEERLFGEDSVHSLSTLNGLARAYEGQSRFAKLEVVLRRRLAIEQSLPVADTADTLYSLAEALCNQGKYAEAEPVARRALAEVDSHYCDQAASYSRLAGNINLVLGNTSEAFNLYQLNPGRPRRGYLGTQSTAAKITIPTDVSDVLTAGNNPYFEIYSHLQQLHDEIQWSARQELTKKYSWAIPNEDALAVIMRNGPVVEIGAGTGYWAALLRQRGADILAFDRTPVGTGRNGWHFASRKSWTEVLKGDVRQARLYPERTLMLCWPPYNEPMAHEALKAFKGDRLIYIGEGRGGCTADDAFHRLLQRNWKIVEEVGIPQWDGIHDDLAVYRRKRGRK